MRSLGKECFYFRSGWECFRSAQCSGGKGATGVSPRDALWQRRATQMLKDKTGIEAVPRPRRVYWLDRERRGVDVLIAAKHTYTLCSNLDHHRMAETSQEFSGSL
jgi:hypothetical protein